MFTAGILIEESRLSEENNGRDRKSKLEGELECGPSFV